MSEDSLQGQQETAVPPAPPASVGERLRAAREARGLDVDSVAAALKLSRRQIEALDAGDWAKLPGYTFIRGFVRNYARLVQLDELRLLADLDSTAPQPPPLGGRQTSTAVMPETGRVQKRDYATVLAGVVLVLTAVLAYYVVPADFWQSGKRELPPPATSQESVTPFPPATVSATEAAAPQMPASETAAALPPASAGTGKGLVLSFTQPSWVEIRDRSGQVIFSQLNPAGSEREVEGLPPFLLVVGNASNVTVRYQGRNIDLQPRSKDDVARVTVE